MGRRGVGARRLPGAGVPLKVPKGQFPVKYTRTVSGPVCTGAREREREREREKEREREGERDREINIKAEDV